MSERLLTAVLVLQTLLLAGLLAERLVPTAQASTPVSCEITNWPDAIKGSGFASVRVRLEDLSTPVPVVIKDWATSDEVRVNVTNFDTSDTVRVNVADWSTSSRVRIEQ